MSNKVSVGITKGSALVSILIAFAGGIVLGFYVGKGKGGASEPTAEVSPEGAGDEGDGTGAAAPGAERAGGDTQEDIYRVPVGDSAAKGPADALVTIVEFSEFQCPFCSRVGPTLRRIQQEYGNRVRIVFKHNPLPFHDNAMPAAELAQEALAQRGADGFWRAHDLLFENQRALTRPDLERYATQLGLDANRVRQALDNHTHQARIQQDMQLAARLGARGTPAFFINGRQLMGAQPYEEFKRIIDEEITRANRVLATGVQRTRLYAELTKNGRTSAPDPAARGAAGAAGAGANAPQPPRRTEDPTAVYRVPVTADQPSKGARNALVTIVEFSEYQCPFCKRVGPTVAQILERYPTQVRIVWRDNPLPFHDNAMPAAELAREAFAQRGAEGFWRAHDLLFENQQALTRPDLDRYAEQLGLNMTRYRAAMDGHTHQAAIQADQAIARQFGASGTPSFFINGVKLRGAQPFEAFQRVIDEQIAKAQEAIRAGRATAANVYDVLTRDGATAPVMRDAPAAPGGQQPAANREPAEDPNRVYAIAVPARAPMKGNARARVTIQIFSDFECPFCSRVLPTIRQIEEQYGDRVRFVWRDYPLPFHQRATPAAEAAREVFTQRGSEAFWRYHDLLFQNQRDLSDETLARLAGEVGGINMDRFRAAMSGRTHQAAVRADMDAVQQAGARIGTPSFFINGRLLQGAQPIDAFRQAIDAALAAPAGAGANPRPAAGGGADAPRPRAPRPTAPPSGGQ